MSQYSLKGENTNKKHENCTRNNKLHSNCNYNLTIKQQRKNNEKNI